MRNLIFLRSSILKLEQEILQIKLSCLDTQLQELNLILVKVMSNAPFIDIYDDTLNFFEAAFLRRRKDIDERSDKIQVFAQFLKIHLRRCLNQKRKLFKMHSFLERNLMHKFHWSSDLRISLQSSAR